MEQDRRRNPRYPFVGSIEMREGTSEDKRTARVKELSLNGCYVDTQSPYPLGASLAIKLFTETEFFEAQASVIYSQADQGMGLMFRETKPYYLLVPFPANRQCCLDRRKNILHRVRKRAQRTQSGKKRRALGGASYLKERLVEIARASGLLGVQSSGGNATCHSCSSSVLLCRT